MTARDALILILLLLVALKVTLWLLKKRERFHAYASLALGVLSQACAWVVAAQPTALEFQLTESTALSLPESFKYPLAISVAVVDYVITILVLRSRASRRLDAVATALARCTRHPTLDRYREALVKSKITEPAQQTIPELELVKRDHAHAETRRRASVILNEIAGA